MGAFVKTARYFVPLKTEELFEKLCEHFSLNKGNAELLWEASFPEFVISQNQPSPRFGFHHVLAGMGALSYVSAKGRLSGRDTGTEVEIEFSMPRKSATRFACIWALVSFIGMCLFFLGGIPLVCDPIELGLDLRFAVVVISSFLIMNFILFLWIFVSFRWGMRIRFWRDSKKVEEVLKFAFDKYGKPALVS
ncbi:MAG: hypothetical protein L0Y72_25565 [Gemmataceae bacterium]|nr:hypothetical protein [Gemmataceae bacterium]MCI0742415.1 hypothetical protein [Gemmataceae bacterium]